MINDNTYITYKLYNHILKENLNFVSKLNLFNKAIINNVIVIYTLNIHLPYVVHTMIIKNIILINLIKKCIKRFIPLVFICKNNKYGVLVNIFKLINHKEDCITIIFCGLEKVKNFIIKKYEFYSISNVTIIKDKLISNKITNDDIFYIKNLSLYINNNLHFNFLLENYILNFKNIINLIYYITYNFLLENKYKFKILNTSNINNKFFYLKKGLIICILKHIIHL
ncbi:MAG: hypothetical protein V9V01_00460 [Candidatus Shikimatogenerans sp. Tmey]